MRGGDGGIFSAAVDVIWPLISFVLLKKTNGIFLKSRKWQKMLGYGWGLPSVAMVKTVSQFKEFLHLDQLILL